MEGWWRQKRYENRRRGIKRKELSKCLRGESHCGMLQMLLWWKEDVQRQRGLGSFYEVGCSSGRAQPFLEGGFHGVPRISIPTSLID
jgi:hypothetical protein